MIKVTFDSEKRARVQFSSEVAHGVIHKGSYTAVGEPGVGWHGRFDGQHRPFDFPACSHHALSAYREDKFMVDPTRAARKTLAERCLKAVIDAARENPAQLVAAEVEALKADVERAEESLAEAKEAAAKAYEQLVTKCQALHNFQLANGLKSEAS